MTLQEMIFKRSSCRSFTGQPVSEDLLETIRAFPMKPLYPNIKVHWEIVPRNHVKCICPWTTPQVITIYSEEKDGYLEMWAFCSSRWICICKLWAWGYAGWALAK